MFHLGDAWLWLAPAAGFIVHFTVGRQNARRVAQQWEALPKALDARRLGQIRSAVECDGDTLQIAMESARQALAEGDDYEARRQMGIACVIVEDAVPDRLLRLKALALVARMAGAIEPLPALSPSSYRLWRLRALALTGYLAHDFLLGPATRLMLRMHLLRTSLTIVRGALARCQIDLERNPGSMRAWQVFDAAVDDFCVLDEQHLSAVSACLVSTQIQPRLQVLPHRLR